MTENYNTRCIATVVSILMLVGVAILSRYTGVTTAVIVFFALGPLAVVWGLFPHGTQRNPGWRRHYAWLMTGGGWSLAAVAATKVTRRWNL